MKGLTVKSDAKRFATLRDDQRIIDVAFLFRVRADEGVIGNFQSVEGIQRTMEPFEYLEGGRNTGAHILAGQVKHGRLVLKTGIMISSYLYDWIRAVEVGQKFRRDLIISQLTRDGRPLRVFTVERAWPTEWRAPALDATKSDVPVEELTLVYDDLTLEVNTDVDKA